jgi:hypothetical protein
MAEVLLPEVIANFIASLGDYQIDVFADLYLLRTVSPDDLDFCQSQGDGLWEYRRQIAPSRYAYLLFAHYESADSYVVLHGFRSGPEGSTRSDLRFARRRRKAH